MQGIFIQLACKYPFIYLAIFNATFNFKFTVATGKEKSIAVDVKEKELIHVTYAGALDTIIILRTPKLAMNATVLLI